MCILFVMPYPGYLRYFDTVVRALAARGHDVHLAWEMPTKQVEGLMALADVASVTVHDLPKRDDDWRRAAKRIRFAVDHARYLDARFAGAHYLRDRAAEKVEWPFSPLRRLTTMPRPLLRALLRGLLALERALPRGPAIDAFIRELEPEVVLVSPLVTPASRQADVVASARALGIPTAAAIASWDNLTNKGILRIQPERLIVWNEAQRREASELHGYPADCVVATGAQCFDRWFERRPRRTRADFCERVGLTVEEPFFLFVGSTASISAPDAEKRFVQAWLRRMRAHPDLRDRPVLIRPHPYNSGHWAADDLAGFENVAVWPRTGANPVDESDRDDYFESLAYSEVVIGINTTAMVEAAILGRPVLTVAAEAFADTQGGTLHFQHLLPENGGFVRHALALDEHLEQLAAAVADPEAASLRTREFVHSFLRPRGLDRDATTPFVEAVEAIAELTATPVERKAIDGVLRAGLRALVIADLARDGRWRKHMRKRVRRVRGRVGRLVRLLGRVASAGRNATR